MFPQVEQDIHAAGCTPVAEVGAPERVGVVVESDERIRARERRVDVVERRVEGPEDRIDDDPEDDDDAREEEEQGEANLAGASAPTERPERLDRSRGGRGLGPARHPALGI